jgi:hypothetical protein
MKSLLKVAPSMAGTLILGLLGTAQAATYGVGTEVSPMPITAGEPFTIKTRVTGPLSDAKALVSVRSGTKIVLEPAPIAIGAVGAGQQVVPIPGTFVIPPHPRVTGISVSVTFVEGSETYVGEPGPDRALKLPGRCQGRDGRVAKPCQYATARYWIQITKVKPN